MNRNYSSRLIRQVARQYFKANNTRNLILACAIILTTILITVSCSTYYGYLKMAKNQELKELGTTANIIVSRPTVQQLEKMRQLDIIQPEMNIQTKLGSLVNNQGQAGIDIQMITTSRWEEFNRPLVDEQQGNYPVHTNDIMMSSWLLNRLGYDNPHIGMEVSLSIALHDPSQQAALVERQSFTLSGYYENKSHSRSANQQVVYLSESFLEEHPQGTPNLVELLLKSTANYEQKINQIQNALALNNDQELMQVYDGQLNINLQNISVALLIMLFFILNGYLIIYNVAYISVSQDVQFYGLLKLLGATTMQIKRIMYYSVARVAALALPVGMFIGWGLSLYIAPLALSSLNGLSALDHEVNIWVLLLSMAVSVFTLWLSYLKPVKVAAQTSPILASKHVEMAGSNFRMRRKTSVKAIHMALNNVLRHKKRLLIVIMTLFLSSTVLLTLSTFLRSFSVEEYINAEIKYDIALYNQMSRASFSSIEEQHFTPELMDSIQGIRGIQEIRRTTVIPVYQHYSDANYSEWLRIANEFRLGTKQRLIEKSQYEHDPKTNFWGLLIGIDNEVLEEYNRTAKTPIQVRDFAEGRIALVTDINGSGIPVGAEIPFNTIDDDQSFQIKVGGQMTLERDSMNSGAAPWLIVSNDVINRYAADPVIYSVKINAKEGQQQEVLDQIIQLTQQDSSLARTSKLEQSQAFADLKRSFLSIATVTIVILSSIGILNFFNTMLVSVVSRKNEFAILSSIGGTEKQIKRMIALEGVWVAVFSILLTLSLGSCLSYFMFSLLRGQLGYGTFYYPIGTLLLYMGGILLICAAAPTGIYKLIARPSVIEQLRYAGK